MNTTEKSNLYYISEQYQKLHRIKESFIEDPLSHNCKSWNLENFFDTIKDCYNSRKSQKVILSHFKFNELAILNAKYNRENANKLFSEVIQAAADSIKTFSDQFLLFRDRNHIYAIIHLSQKIDPPSCIGKIDSLAYFLLSRKIAKTNSSTNLFESSYQEITSAEPNQQICAMFQEQIVHAERRHAFEYCRRLPPPPAWAPSVERQLRFILNFLSAAPDSTREAALEYYKKLMGTCEIDACTRLYKETDRKPAITNVLKLKNATPGLNAYLIESDIRNLSGVNQKFGREEGNEILRFTAFETCASLLKANFLCAGFRIGGDELGFVATSEKSSAEDAKQAMQEVQSKIQARFKKCHQICHKKYPADPSKKGTGIVFTVVEITENATVSEITQTAASQIEQNKLQE